MKENIRVAISGIWAHKMRSFLTMLGIIIGIASIIAIVSTIKGTSEQIKDDLIGSGNNTVKIDLYQGDNQYDADFSEDPTEKAPVISSEEKEEIRKLKAVVNATFYYKDINTFNVYVGNANFNGGTMLGIDKTYMDTLGYTVKQGRDFVQQDYKNRRNVIILDQYASDKLFQGKNPIGKTVEIDSNPFVVVGIVSQQEDALPNMDSVDQFYEYYQDINGTIFIPDVDWSIINPYDQPQNAVVRATSPDTMDKAGNETAKILNKGIKNSKDSKSKFEYRADDVMKRVRNLQKLSESTNTQLLWIASISLLVGGIGVMNIMLVSVTERTKEIGLKKAIGARKAVILSQFLTEAAVLTSIGGIIGVLLGIGLSKVVSSVAGSPTAISIPAIIGSVIFSMIIGIVFGLLPSIKAANLNPIDALRSE